MYLNFKCLQSFHFNLGYFQVYQFWNALFHLFLITIIPKLIDDQVIISKSLLLIGQHRAPHQILPTKMEMFRQV